VTIVIVGDKLLTYQHLQLALLYNVCLCRMYGSACSASEFSSAREVLASCVLLVFWAQLMNMGCGTCTAHVEFCMCSALIHSGICCSGVGSTGKLSMLRDAQPYVQFINPITQQLLCIAGPMNSNTCLTAVVNALQVALYFQPSHLFTAACEAYGHVQCQGWRAVCILVYH
jgi:hypothetical protein